MPEAEEAEEQPDFIHLDLGPIEHVDHFPSNLQATTTLSLTFCDWVTTTLLLEISTHMKNLLDLDLSGCTNIRGEFSLNSIAQLDNLRTLNINYMHPSISGWFLQSLTSLTEIHLRGNTFIQDEEIGSMLGNCTQLEIIDVEACNRIGHPLLVCASYMVRNQTREKPVSLYVGTMTAKSYIKILENSLLRSLEKWGKTIPDVIFQHDNDPKHKANCTKQWLATQGFQVLDWPPQSPDLNPIEHLWGLLKRSVANFEPGSRSSLQLWADVVLAWQNIQREQCRNLVDSMPRRIKAVIKAKGGYTKY
ncbi:Transposable element Tcb1 transposase [Anthophora plagiata]